MLEFIKHVLGGQNQFASGGLLLMILGSIGVFLRALPQRLWVWLVAQTTMTVSVKDEDDACVWAKEWFLEQKVLKRIRRVDLDTTLRGAELALTPHPAGAGLCGATGHSGFGFTTAMAPRVEFAESHSVETLAEFQGLLLALVRESTILAIASICD